VGDAVPVRDLVTLMEETGFKDVEFAGRTGIVTTKFSEGALFRASKWV
jgi:hypothetical protein